MSAKMITSFGVVLICLFELTSCAWPTNVTELIRGYGYVCEDHTAITPDGYELSIQRIPHGKNGKSGKGVVFYQHGLVDCSIGAVLNPPNEAFPFILSELGYDIWLGNNRGNGYSMKNKNFPTNSDQFWDFSWDQMALSDMPTQIEYVLSQTGKSKLTYIGHSEGTTQAFAGLIANPSLENKLNLYVALAPVAYVGHIKAFLAQVLSKLPDDIIFDVLGRKEFNLPEALHKLVPDVCEIDPTLCDNVLNALMGPSHNLNVSRMDYYLNYEPNPTSVKNMVQWAQGVRSDKFQMFDYGTAGNIAHYNQTTPPQYDLGKFPTNLPTVFFSGGEDYLADPTDVARLLKDISKQPVLHNFQPTYAHVDFLWAEHANTQIYPILVQEIEKYNV